MSLFARAHTIDCNGVSLVRLCKLIAVLLLPVHFSRNQRCDFIPSAPFNLVRVTQFNIYACMSFSLYAVLKTWDGKFMIQAIPGRNNNKSLTLKSLWFFSFALMNRHIDWFVCLFICLFNALICSLHFTSYWSFGWHLCTIRQFASFPLLRYARINMFSSLFYLKYKFFLSKYSKKVPLFCSIKCCLLNSNAVISVWPWQTKPYRHPIWDPSEVIQSECYGQISPNVLIFKYF